MSQELLPQPGCREEDKPYQMWVKAFDTLSEDDCRRITERIELLDSTPLISVVMPVYNSPELFLRRALDSVLAQLYTNWELCIADDCSTEPHVAAVLREYAALDSRVRVVLRSENGHIVEASNTALEMAQGEFVALLDHDDELPTHALYLVVEEINDHPDVGVIYSDEDKMDECHRRFNPYFKPDWNPDQFLAQNCISHLGVYRRSLMEEVGGFRKGFEGSQDYDLALRCIDLLQPTQVRHIPYVLYHWRATDTSAAKGLGLAKPYAFVAAERAITEYLARHGTEALVRETGLAGMYRVMHRLPRRLPLLSIIVPFCDNVRMLASCVGSIIVRSTYQHVELILVDNRSREAPTQTFLSSLSSYKCVRVLPYDAPFSWPAAVNSAARVARGSILCFLHSDTELLNKDSLSEMVSQALRPEIGAVGARLTYPNKTLQHCGVTLSPTAIARHVHRDISAVSPGYYGQAWMVRNVAAVSGACLMVRREPFAEAGEFDETMPGAYSDVDFCLRLGQRGLRNVFTAYAQLLHHEKNRGQHDPEAHPYETAIMRQRWSTLLQHDPAWSPNLCPDSEGILLACPPRRATPWRDANSVFHRPSELHGQPVPNDLSWG